MDPRVLGLPLHVKTFDTARRTITGIASTPELDRQGHSLDPAGVTFRNPIPLLWQHERDVPVGTATLLPPTDEGIPFEASLPILNTPGALKDRVDLAWQSVEAGLVRSVSIGFRLLDKGIQAIKGGGYRLTKTEILELSLVTIPANLNATILSIKAAASGLDPVGGATPPVVVRVKGARAMQMTTREQITTFENSRAAKAARMVAIMNDAGNAGNTLDQAQSEEYDGLDREVKSLDDHLTRLRRAESLNVASAVPIPAAPDPAALAMVRGPVPPAPAPVPIVQVRSPLPPATAFVRMVKAMAACRGDRMAAIEFAKQWHDSTPEVELALKAAVAVAPGTTTDVAWAGPLVTVQNLANEFVELLRPATVLGKVPGLRTVPFNVSVPVQTAGGSYGWVGQGAPKPVTKLAFAPVKLDVTKAAAIIVITDELARLSTPSAEATVR